MTSLGNWPAPVNVSLPSALTAAAKLELALARKAARDDIGACQRCDCLSPLGHSPVPFRGPAPARVMVIGEAPGSEEDRQGQPFVGQSGILLKLKLKEVGLALDDCFVTNAARCYPGHATAPKPRHVTACLFHLRREVQLVQPEWVLTLGKVALSLAHPKPQITKLHGRPFEVFAGPLVGRKVFPSYHPAAALRSEQVAKVFRMDLGSFAEILSGAVSWREYGRGPGR